MTSPTYDRITPLSLRYWFRGQCLNCRASTSGPGLCSACQEDLPHMAGQRQCQRCALPLPRTAAADHSLCPECLQQPPAFDSTSAAFVYAEPISPWLQQLKYRGNLRLGRALMHQALPVFLKADQPQLLIPIPMPLGRLWRRGFNQADWICRQLARGCGLSCARVLCNRQRCAPRQASANRATRLHNQALAFAVLERHKHLIRGKHVALVDDVMTTGATLRSASKILKDCGACRVDLWIIARTAKSNGIQDKN